MSKSLSFVQDVVCISVAVFFGGLLVMGWVPEWTHFLNSLH